MGACKRFLHLIFCKLVLDSICQAGLVRLVWSVEYTGRGRKGERGVGRVRKCGGEGGKWVGAWLEGIY